MVQALYFALIYFDLIFQPFFPLYFQVSLCGAWFKARLNTVTRNIHSRDRGEAIAVQWPNKYTVSKSSAVKQMAQKAGIQPPMAMKSIYSSRNTKLGLIKKTLRVHLRFLAMRTETLPNLTLICTS